MADNESRFVARNFSLDEETIDRLDSICNFRRSCADMRKGYASNSRVLRDAIAMYYRYEVLQQSVIHPKDV